MYCSKCGKQNEIGAKFCTSCGSLLEVTTNGQETVQDNPNNNVNSVNEEFLASQSNDVQTPPSNNIPNNTPNGKNTKAVISLILGIVSFALSFVAKILVLPISVVGLVFGLIDHTSSKMRNIGIILNVVDMVVAIAMFFSPIIYSNYIDHDDYVNPDDSVNQVYYGDGFQINYGSDWSTTTLSGGQEALEYQHQSAYLLAIGNSSLSDGFDCNFEDLSCQNKIYNEFYTYWNSDGESSGRHLYGGSNNFSLLKDDIYYATMDYGISANELRGKMYLLISKGNNAILSFMSNSMNPVLYDSKFLSLLQNITINVKYDDYLYNELDSMSNWNRYSNLRTGQLAKNVDINGGWRILSDYETYWVFENGEFYWYKSVNDLNDNYWYGTTRIIKGAEGLRLAGLDENKINDFSLQNNGQVTNDNIYVVFCTPTKVIVDGVDKSSTNLKENTQWNLVWIIIDHGTEGIEGQMINVSNYDVGYYVKIKD